MADCITIGMPLTVEDVERVAVDQEIVQVPEFVVERIQTCRDHIEEQIGPQKPLAYGINTGFGALAEVRISAEQIRQLQENLVRSHACGVGEPLSMNAVRAIMLLRAQTLAQGHSGCRPAVVQHIANCLNAQFHPFIPSKGSVGASGDLAPLAHLAYGQENGLDSRQNLGTHQRT